MAQRYTDPTALERMKAGVCPECGYTPESHTGWGSGVCTLTDNGVAERIMQFTLDQPVWSVP